MNARVMVATGLGVLGLVGPMLTLAATTGLPVVRCNQPALDVVVHEFTCTAATCRSGQSSAGIYAVWHGGMSANVAQDIQALVLDAMRLSGCFKQVDYAKYLRARALVEATGQSLPPPRIDFVVDVAVTELSINGVEGFLGFRRPQLQVALAARLTQPALLDTAPAKIYRADTTSALAWDRKAYAAWTVSASPTLNGAVRQVVVTMVNELVDANVPEESVVLRPPLLIDPD